MYAVCYVPLISEQFEINSIRIKFLCSIFFSLANSLVSISQIDIYVQSNTCVIERKVSSHFGQSEENKCYRVNSISFIIYNITRI